MSTENREPEQLVNAGIGEGRAGIGRSVEEDQRTAAHCAPRTIAAGAADDHGATAQGEPRMIAAAAEQDQEPAPHRLPGQRSAAAFDQHGDPRSPAASGQRAGEPLAGIPLHPKKAAARFGGGERTHATLDLHPPAAHAETEFDPGIAHDPDRPVGETGTDAITEPVRAFEDEASILPGSRTDREELARGHGTIAVAQRDGGDLGLAPAANGLG